MYCPHCCHYITDDEMDLVDTEFHQSDIIEETILIYKCPKCKGDVRCTA